MGLDWTPSLDEINGAITPETILRYFQERDARIRELERKVETLVAIMVEHHQARGESNG